MSTFYITILKNIHRIIYHILKIRQWMRHKDKHSEQDRYEYAQKIVEILNRSSHCTTIAYGQENLPAEGGYMMYPNHQGKYDVLGIMLTHEQPCTFVMDEERSHMPLVVEIMMLLEAKVLVFDDLRQNIRLFQEMSDEIQNRGRKFILFPEGGYEQNNGNKVETFKAGSFKAAQMAKCPIVPVALVDSYKVYNSPEKAPFTTYVYYLEPLYYEDYKDMKTREIASVVEQRIRDKVNEHLQG